ncbi:MAG: hypothetical protein IJU19_08420 [Bacteroidales bacterium]|nr:hypothetical protein [Bacteroidales bacterium]
MNQKRIFKLLKNKYVITTIGFLVIILFSSDLSLQVNFRIKRELRKLQAEERALREAMSADSIAAAELNDNPAAKERYGRENYYMKRANEDVFVIK